MEQSAARLLHRKWGPALLPAPTAPSEGYAGVRNLVKTRRPRPALDPGSPAQASLPIEQLPPRRSPTGLPDCAARGFAGLSPDPAWRLGTEVPRNQNRPMFCGPSWVDHSRVPLCFATIRRPLRSRVALEEDRLFRRLFPAGPERNPKAPSIACRRRSDLWSPAALFLPLRTFRGGRDRRPDHLSTMHLSPESQKRKMG